MSSSNNPNGSTKSRRNRTFKVAPMTRAVRVALAASLAALALGASGGAFAADCKTSTTVMATCDQVAAIGTPVLDLTSVKSAGGARSLVENQADPVFDFAWGGIVENLDDPVFDFAAADVVVNNADPISESDTGRVIDITAISYGGDVHVTNQSTGALDAYSMGGLAGGIFAQSYGGDARVDNSGDIYAYSDMFARGITVLADGAALVLNDGQVAAFGDEYAGTGIFAAADNLAIVQNNGSVYGGSTYGTATGIHAESIGGLAAANNFGDVEAYSKYGNAIGLAAYSFGGDASAANLGDVTATSKYGAATGMYAGAGGNASAYNSGDVYAYSTFGTADGIFAVGATAGVGNNGYIGANGYYSAAGIQAHSVDGTSVGNGSYGFINAFAYGDAAGINASASDGDVVVGNAGFIQAYSIFGNGTGISALTGYGDIDVQNSSSVVAVSINGSAIGAYGYSYDGGVVIGNDGDITAVSVYGLADGIFASGVNADASNSGDIVAASLYGNWAAGIEAQSDEMTTVDNSGSIYASAYYGAAYGIYATGNTVEVGNSGSIHAQGYYSTGIEAQGGSSAIVTNSGDINAGELHTETYAYTYTYDGNEYTNYYTYTLGTAVATGINASTSDAGGEASVTNSGDISAVSIYGSTGIAATSTGTGGTASVTNSGSVHAYQYNKYGYGGYGVVASGDGDASIENTSTGSITVYSGGTATGAAALSFAGNASVTNAGDITVDSTAALYYGAYGILSFAQNGDAYVGNSGNVSAVGKYQASAVDAAAYGDVTVDNSGSLYANGGKYAFGVKAYSGAGDVMVDNHEGGSIEAYSYNGRSFGVLGVAYQGDVGVNNAGSIHAYGYGQAVGVFGVALEGDTTITNSGDITAITGGDAAIGIFARSDYGTSTVDNSGDIVATVEGVNGFTGDVAYGIIARGEYADVSNSGTIDVNGFYYGTGIAASSYYGTMVDNSGSIYAYAVGGATGIDASSFYGDVSVDNSGSIDAIGIVFGATGIDASSVYGDVSVDNSGDIFTYSEYGNSTAINAYSVYGTADIQNSGDVTLLAYTGDAIGLYGYSYAGDVSINNDGNILAVSFYGLADGIFASGVNVDVSNSGDITALSLFGNWAAGIEAESDGLTTVDNSGDIYASAGYGSAYGIYATGDVIEITNSGNIEAQGYYATGIEAQGGSSVTITNDGSIVAGSSYYTVVGAGINASSNYEGGSIDITNNGDVSAMGYYGGTGIAATATGTGGTGSVTNNGSIFASQYSKYGYGAYGIVVSADGDATIENTATGSITVDSGGLAFGAAALSFAGDASVTNAGDISVSGDALVDYGAYGVLAFALNGSAYASNSGDIDVTTKYNGVGIDASGQQGATVDNSGDIAVDAWRAYGIRANSGLGDVDVSNSGSISSVYTYGLFDGTAFGILASSTQGDVSVDNSGYIYTSVTGQSVGIFGVSSYGDVSVTNSGDIASYSYISTAAGIFARADYGTASVENSGSIIADAYYGDALGILARGDYADVSNSGDISAVGFYSATGIAASSYYGTTVANTASGSISAHALGEAIGIDASSIFGDASATNAGDIEAVGDYYGGTGLSVYSVYGNATASNNGSIYASSLYGNAIGVHADAIFGDASASNSGDIDAVSIYGNAIGVYGSSLFGDARASNTGSILSTSYYGTAVGVAASSVLGTAFASNSSTINAIGVYGDAVGMQAVGDHAQATNSGSVDAYGYYSAIGVGAFSYYGTLVSNSGDIYAASPDGSARGIYAYSLYGNVVVNNSGDVVASSDADAAAVEMGTGNGTATLNNSGTLSVDAPLEGQIAVLGSDSKEVINNTGDIYGSVVLLGGDDTFNNLNHGVWHLDNHSTDFGAGSDHILNAAGGLITMSDAAIHMGTGTDWFHNLGVITISGDNLIDMGLGDAGAFTNTHLVDFLDGQTDDKLSIIGNFGGSGTVALDVDLPTDSSDQIFVQGNMTANAAQHVDILFEGLPTVANTSIDFARVTGTSVANSFVPGQVLGYNYPRNFIDLQFTIGSRINTANTAPDVFSIDLDVVGLLDSGTLAANVASGAAGMLNAQIGTFKQRMGVNPYGDAGKVMSAFFRYYSSEGDVTPGHFAENFGQGGNFDYSLNTWGQEVGVNANLFSTFHAGVALGTADGRQRLTGAGIGENRMDGMTWSAYATWFAPQGFYVDLSGRWMAVDVRSTSAAGALETRAHTKAANLEVGYPWTTGGGFTITPQLQYTHAEVEDVRSIYGDRADFEGEGGTSSRTRLGVEFSKTFLTSGGMNITPYGSINAIREDGEMNYTVADNFFGTVDTQGTSSMLDLGIGLQKGGFGLTAGANWVDGGAFNSVVGGQVVVRFAW